MSCEIKKNVSLDKKSYPCYDWIIREGKKWNYVRSLESQKSTGLQVWMQSIIIQTLVSLAAYAKYRSRSIFLTECIPSILLTVTNHSKQNPQKWRKKKCSPFCLPLDKKDFFCYTTGDREKRRRAGATGSLIVEQMFYRNFGSSAKMIGYTRFHIVKIQYCNYNSIELLFCL